ncbi:MAG: hypothetical protein ACOYU2_05880 [Nitrospirota bacterium]
MNQFEKENIKHPQFIEGDLAFYNGIELSDNPYAVDTEFFSEWESGWKAASQTRKIFEEKNKTTKASSQFGSKLSDIVYEVMGGVGSLLLGLLGLSLVAGILYALYWFGKAILGFVKYYSQFA